MYASVIDFAQPDLRGAQVVESKTRGTSAIGAKAEPDEMFEPRLAFQVSKKCLGVTLRISILSFAQKTQAEQEIAPKVRKDATRNHQGGTEQEDSRAPPLLVVLEYDPSYRASAS